MKIKNERRPMVEAEYKYSFMQSTQLSMQTGLIGHLRAYMDCNPEQTGFTSSWFDYRKELKTDEFIKEFDDVINSLRKKGDFLYNRQAMLEYCYSNVDSKMSKGCGNNYFGFRIDTERYTYMLRLDPNRGVYNFYCYCYKRDWLEHHISEASKGIRFINSKYKTLFYIPDGGKIKIMSNGEERICTCRYIDEYHLEVSGGIDNIYHICEFAERMERSGNTYEPFEEKEKGVAVNDYD